MSICGHWIEGIRSKGEKALRQKISLRLSSFVQEKKGHFIKLFME
jgi:hypothetical protein